MVEAEIEIEILYSHPLTSQPKRLPFIDPSIGWLKQVGEFGPGQPLIFVTETTWRLMESHTRSTTKQEVGGLVLGHFCVDGDLPFVWVETALPAHNAVGSAGGLRFTPDSIAEIDEEREARYPSLQPVGWYHSHPGFGIFLSSIDLHSHYTVFCAGPFLAIVLDPVQKTDGVFGWIDGEVKGPLAYWVVGKSTADLNARQIDSTPKDGSAKEV